MRAKKSLGQNFLTDANYRKKIITAVLASNPQTLLEIGPGHGALTDLLIGQVQNFVLVEKDFSLAAALQVKYSKIENPPKIIQGDFLDVDLADVIPVRLGGGIHPNITVVGNLPYNAASPILARLMEERKYFKEFFLMFQKEVALRLIAKPGTKDYSLLTLLAKIYSDAEILFHVPPTAFRPRPKVISSVVHFKIKPVPLVNDIEAPFFWKIVRLLFQQRRKTILSVLKGVEGMDKNHLEKHISPNARAEAYTVEELINLTRILSTP